jgi:hypothetical protein
MSNLRVWQRANDVVVLDNTRDRLIVWPHHPDQLRRTRPQDQALWADLAAMLRDCEESRVLSDIEGALAGNALTWLA